MMMQIDALAFWVVAGILVWFLYGPWQAFWADWFRQEAFSARDRLFDKALDGELSFDSADYQAARSSINFMIRHADELTWTQTAMMIFAVERVPKHSVSESPGAGAVSPTTWPVVDQMMSALVFSLAMRAPALWAPILLVLLWAVATKGFANATNFARSSVRRATTELSACW